MIDLAKYSKRQRLALERLAMRDAPEPMVSRDPHLRETRVMHDRWRCVTGLQIHDDTPMVWNGWFGVIDTQDALIGHDDYFVPTKMWELVDGLEELCATWLAEVMNLPRDLSDAHCAAAQYPKARPVTNHMFIPLDEDERRYVQDIIDQRLRPTVKAKDPGWNLLPGELDEE